MNARTRWCRVLLGVSLIALALLPGCERRAPGPELCVRFAEMTFGHDVQSLLAYPAYKAIFDRLVTTCLTAPFDRRVFPCMESSRAPMDCLKRYQPELFGDSEMVPVLPRDFRGERF